MEQFAYRFNRTAEKFPAPDAIVADTYCVSYKPIFRYCERHHIPFVVDVRDLWPQSIVEYMNLSENNPIIRVMYHMERKMYERADKIIFSFDGGYDYIQDRKLENVIPREKVFFINNGVDLNEFEKNSETYKTDDEDLDNPTTFKVVYAGSIRKVNNLGLLLDAAKKVKNNKVRFLIWGTGDELEKLQKRITDEKIGNVIFKGYVEKKYIPYITRKADLNLIHNNPSDIFKYGISFNKLFDYMASGKPTLTTFPCKYNPAVYEGTGVDLDTSTPQAIAGKIDELSESDLTSYKEKALEASKKYDYKALSMRLLDILSGINR